MLFFRIFQLRIRRISHTAHAVLVESTLSTSRCAEFGASSLSFRKVGEHVRILADTWTEPALGYGLRNTGILSCKTMDTA
jgi:hypothetical protein